MHYSSKENINKNKTFPAISLQKASPRAPAFASPSAACSRAPPQHQYCCTGETRPRTTETAKATRGFGRKNQQTGECNASDSAQAGLGSFIIYLSAHRCDGHWGSAREPRCSEMLKEPFSMYLFLLFFGELDSPSRRSPCGITNI